MTIQLLISRFSHDPGRSIQVQDSECLDRIASLVLYCLKNWIPDSHDLGPVYIRGENQGDRGVPPLFTTHVIRDLYCDWFMKSV